MTSQPQNGQESLHALIARLRAERRLSVAQLAASTGLSPNAVRWIERGITQPKPESLRALAGALGIPYELLLQKAGYLEALPAPSPDQDILTLYQALTPDKQAIIRQLLQVLVEPSTAGSPDGPVQPEAQGDLGGT